MSSFFTKPAAIVNGTTADSADVNDLSDAVEAAFDAVELGGGSQYTVSAKGNMTGAVSLDLAVANYFTGTVTGNTTLTFANPVASGAIAQGFVLEINNGGAFTVTWPASVDWAGGVPPSLTASGKDILAFLTSDYGVTWHGMVSSLDSQ